MMKINFLLLIFILIGCSENYTPLPKGYMRINLPDNSYQLTEIPCPFTFNYSKHANLTENNNCWFNVTYFSLNAKIHCTYKKINENLDELLQDAHSMVYNHIMAADGIKETVYTNELKTGGLLYSLEGNAATPLQFFITDSNKHFLRGALYFNCEPNSDSLKPVINYIEKDIRELMNSIVWDS